MAPHDHSPWDEANPKTSSMHGKRQTQEPRMLKLIFGCEGVSVCVFFVQILCVKNGLEPLFCGRPEGSPLYFFMQDFFRIFLAWKKFKILRFSTVDSKKSQKIQEIRHPGVFAWPFWLPRGGGLVVFGTPGGGLWMFRSPRGGAWPFGRPKGGAWWFFAQSRGGQIVFGNPGGVPGRFWPMPVVFWHTMSVRRFPSVDNSRI